MTRSASERAAWCVLFALHAAAVQWLFPWSEVLRTDPILDCDYPIHAQRVHLYRECLFQNGIPWGCDPSIMTGQVLDPAQDTTKPQQVLGVLLWRLPAAQVVRLYLWLTAAAMPLGAFALFRTLRLDGPQKLWSMIVFLAAIWLFQKLSIFFQWGMAAFLSASLFAPLVLALFLSFLEQPNWRAYCWFLAAASLLFLLHVTGPFIIAAPLVVLTLSARPLGWKWRLALMATPFVVLLLNSFWAVPCYWAIAAPRPDWAPVPAQLLHPFLKYGSLARVGEIMISPSGLLAIAASLVGVYGSVILRRQAPDRHLAALGLAIATVGFMMVFGSFIPVLHWMQPVRFAVPAAVLLSVPVGSAVAHLVRRLSMNGQARAMPEAILPAFTALALAAGAVHWNLPRRIHCKSADPALAAFIATHTAANDRLLVQACIEKEPAVFPIVWNREVIGCAFPDLDDPLQFSRRALLGRRFADWTPAELMERFETWGISWVLAGRPDAIRLLEQTFQNDGESVGSFRAFKIPKPANRVEIGTARVTASLNRLQVDEICAPAGLLVLRYRFHPAWKSSDGTPILRYEAPGDPCGFIAVRQPPQSLILSFDPKASLERQWPAEKLSRNSERIDTDRRLK